MPITPNYGWTTPVVNGDFGAWGGILNTAFTEIDADIKTLADLVATNALNVAKTNVANSFSATQTFTTINASGNVNAVGNVNVSGSLNGATLATLQAAITNDTTALVANFTGGADGTLGPLGFGVRLRPSATGANRFVQLVAGDNGANRTVHVQTNRLAIGVDTNPVFVGAEVLNVQGAVVATQFTGSGATLTAIPQSAVTSLVSDLAGKSAVGHTHPQSDITGLVAALAAKSDVGHTHAQSDITGLVAALASKAPASHTHDFGDITTGNVPYARVTSPTTLIFDAASTSVMTVVSNQIDAISGTATTTLNRPSGDAAYAIRGWRWVKVDYPGQLAAFMPVWVAANV